MKFHRIIVQTYYTKKAPFLHGAFLFIQFCFD